MSLRSAAPESTKRVGRRLVARSGTVSARWRNLPGYLVVGAQRCGTTSIQRMLAAHPAVVPPLMHKGVHYFDTAHHYARGLDWYRGHFPLRSTMARHATRSGSPTMTGEASPYYLFHPLAAERIARDLPGTKLVVLVRDPVERAFSAHKQETARGFEAEPFERALELEPERLAGEVERIVANPGYQSFAHQHHAYVGRGEYSWQLDRLVAAVGSGRVLILDVDDLHGSDPGWLRLLDFLGLPHWSPGRASRANARPSLPMPDSVRRRLDDHFRPHDERLARLLGAEPSWRRRTG